MLFDGLVRCGNISIIRFTCASALTFRAISPRTHRAILPYFRQDEAVLGNRRTFVLFLVAFILATSFQTNHLAFAKKKEAKPIPSPSPIWPPAGYKGINGVFAKVPSSKELIGLLSARKSLQKTVKQCEEFACGAVIAAAETGCEWWEVTSNVRQVNVLTLEREKVGALVTYTSGSKPKELKTIFLVSQEPVDPGVSISGIRVICHRDSFDKPKSGNIYEKIVTTG